MTRTVRLVNHMGFQGGDGIRLMWESSFPNRIQLLIGDDHPITFHLDMFEMLVKHAPDFFREIEGEMAT